MAAPGTKGHFDEYQQHLRYQRQMGQPAYPSPGGFLPQMMAFRDALRSAGEYEEELQRVARKQLQEGALRRPVQQAASQPNIAQLAQQRASGALTGTLPPGQEVGGWAQGQLAALKGGLKKGAKTRAQRAAGKGKGARRAPTKIGEHAARADTKTLQKSAAAGSNYDGTLLSLIISARRQAANNQLAFVPVYDYKNSRVVLVRADGVDMVYNMKDRRHRDALRSGLLKAKHDPTRVMQMADRISEPLKKSIAQDINTEEDVIKALQSGYL